MRMYAAMILCCLVGLIACDKPGNQLTPVGTGERPTGTALTDHDRFLNQVRAGELAQVRQLLREDRSRIAARDGLGSTALLLAACKTDNLSLVGELFAADPSAIEVGDNRQRTPLSWAAHFDRAEIVEFLINKQAQIDSKDAGGNTPLAYAAMRDALAAAKVLLKNNAQVNTRNQVCDTPLMLAAIKGHVAMVRLLVEHGADPGYEDQEGRTVLDRLQHLDAADRKTIEQLISQAARSTMQPACPQS